MNKVFLIGRLTRDPELRYTGNNTAVATFSIAVNRNFSNQNGEREADFINIVVWRKQAENVKNYLTQGSQVAIDGRIQTRSYDDQNGKKINDIKPTSTSLEENIGLTEPNQNNNARKDIKIISHRSINTSKGKIKNNENNSKLVKTNSFKVKINLDHKKTDSNNQSQRTKININNRNSNNCVTDINNKTAKNDINNVKSHVITSTYHSNNINNNVTYNNNGIKITRTTNTKANIINTNEINKDGKRYITKNVQRIRKEDNGQK